MELRGISQGRQGSMDSKQYLDKTIEQNLDKTKINNTSNNEDVKQKDLKSALDKLNKFLEDNKTHAEYSVHKKLKDVMIKIVDDKTGQVIKEIPPKKILDMVAKMCEMVGMLFDKKA